MLQTIISALAVYVSTSIDYLLILMIIFSKQHEGEDEGNRWDNTGNGNARCVQFICSLCFKPHSWRLIIGLLGLIPLYLGIRITFKGEQDEDEEEVLEKMEAGGETDYFGR